MLSETVPSVDKLESRGIIVGGMKELYAVSILFPFCFHLTVPVSRGGSSGYEDVSNVSTFSKDFRLMEWYVGTGEDPVFFLNSSKNMETLETPLKVT